jgi:hypothetical protein
LLGNSLDCYRINISFRQDISTAQIITAHPNHQQKFIMAKIVIQELNLTISQLVDTAPSQLNVVDSTAIRAISTQEAQAINGGWGFRSFWLGHSPISRFFD